jgi:hypothetical protein
MKTSPRNVACLLCSLALQAGSALAAPTIPAPVAFTVAAPEPVMTSARMKELVALFTKTIAGAATSSGDKTTALEFRHLILPSPATPTSSSSRPVAPKPSSTSAAPADPTPASAKNASKAPTRSVGSIPAMAATFAPARSPRLPTPQMPLKPKTVSTPPRGKPSACRPLILTATGSSSCANNADRPLHPHL